MGARGLLTMAEVMFTIRPKRRSTIPSITSRIKRSGAIRLASTAPIQSSRSHCWNRPGGGPPLLVTRMSGVGQASSRASRVSGSAMSPTTVDTVEPTSSRSAAAAASRRPGSRPLRTTWTPSWASERAHA